MNGSTHRRMYYTIVYVLQHRIKILCTIVTVDRHAGVDYSVSTICIGMNIENAIGLQIFTNFLSNST